MFTDTELEFIQDHLRGWLEASCTGDIDAGTDFATLPVAMFDGDVHDTQQAQSIVRKIGNKWLHDFDTELDEAVEKQEADNKGQEKTD